MSLHALRDRRAAAALVAAACALQPIAAQGAPTPACVVVAGTNDTHGALEPFTYRVGDTELRHGGLVALSGYLTILRQRFGDRLVLLDGGDLYQGTLGSNLSKGRAVIDAYNLLGYHGAAVGNHEFDYGPERADDPDRLGVLKRRMSEAQFPFLALNIVAKATGKPIAWKNLKPSTLVTAGGIPVGVLGVASPSTALTTRAVNVATLRFDNPVPLIVDEARRLRQRGARLVVLVGHVGGACGDLSDPHQLNSCAADEELFEILNALPRGTIDVAVAGHTHAPLAHWVNGTAVIESAGHAKQLAWVEACLLPNGGLDRPRTHIQAPVPLCLDEWQQGGCEPRQSPAPIRPARFLGQPVLPDPRLADRLRPYLDAVARAAAEPVGVCLPHPLPRNRGAGPLGPLVAEAMRQVVQADFAVQNPGGVRADLPAGPLTHGTLYRVLPFDNQVVRLTLRGAQIQAVVEHLHGDPHGKTRRDSRRGPHLAGLRVHPRARGIELRRADGSTLHPKERYAVATNDFLATGGAGLGALFDAVPPAQRTVTDWSLREALALLLRQRFGEAGCASAPPPGPH